MKKLGIVLAGWVAMSTLPASAADMAVKAMPVVAPAWSWTGLYIGFNSAYVRGDTNWYYADNNFAAPGNRQSAHDGSTLGGTIGYNWQMASWVFGVEADYAWSRIRGEVSCGFNVAQACGTNLESFGTIRGRLGYAVKNLMFYATAGGAWGNLYMQERTRATDVVTFDQRQNHWGWTAGAGLEWAAWGNWSTKFEWLYYDLGERDYHTVGGVATDHIRPYGYMFRTGLNYKFNFGGPIAASY